GRPYWLTQTTREWLSHLSFAPGVLHVTDSNREAAPTPEGVGTFKLNFLKKLVEDGFTLDVAHGNAQTDIGAYLEAGLVPDAIWITGKHRGEQGTHAVKDSWEARAREVKGLTPVSQPWQ